MPEAKEKRKKMELSIEERQRRSELAKQLNKKGQFGGRQKGAGRPKKDRAQEHVAEKIREDGEAIYKALKDALKADSPTTKLKAALAMLEIETKEAEYQNKEEQRKYDNISKEKLVELISARMQTLEKAGIRFDPDALAQEILPKGELESGG